MKLLICDKCGDVFNLRLNVLKSCSCGHTKGKYVTNERAVVNGNGHSLAIGNGSLLSAINATHKFPPTDDWRFNRDITSTPYHFIAWARPHDGPANSHTTVDPNL